MVRRSDDQVTPVTSEPFGPVRKRTISPVAGSPTSIWLLPMPAKSPSLLSSPSVWIQSRPALSKAMPSGELKRLPSLMLSDPA